jgi:uncharacterized protein (DUF952 family)
MLVYKLLRSREWKQFCGAAEFAGAPVDLADGFIHFSTAGQVRETAAKHFADAGALWLLSADADALGPDLRWEPSRGGQLFPHLYRPLKRDEILEAVEIAPGPDGAHVFPAGLGGA